MGWAKHNIKVFKDLSKEMKKDQLYAMNQAAKYVKIKEQQEILKVFDRPTSWTRNSVFVKFAKMKDMNVGVGLKDFAGKGTAAADYLYPQIFGGKRESKRSEIALRAKGILPMNKFIVPGYGVKLDQHGNITKGTMTKILSSLGAHNEMGFTANRTKKSTKRNKSMGTIFVAKPFSKLHPGVWQRKGKDIVPLLFFVSAPVYRKRYDFYNIAEKFFKQFQHEIGIKIKNSNY